MNWEQLQRDAKEAVTVNDLIYALMVMKNQPDGCVTGQTPVIIGQDPLCKSRLGKLNGPDDSVFVVIN